MEKGRSACPAVRSVLWYGYLYRGGDTMTEQEYSIMQELKLSGGRKPQSWLESMDSVSRATVRRLLIDKLLGYTGEEPDGLGGVMMTHICLSDKGRVALAAEEEIRRSLNHQAKEKAQENAERKAERVNDVRRSWWQFWFGLLIGWLLGGVTFEEVFTWVLQLTH